MKTLPEILDDHAEYYIRQTMKFFQENGESPALSKNNEGDLKTLKAIAKELMGCLPEKATVDKFYDFVGDHRKYGYLDGYNQCLDEVRARLTAFIGEIEK